ncbi:LOW QUALITY PROTEIN: nuclear pore membrane glycoprotein 210-like [Morus bassanus]
MRPRDRWILEVKEYVITVEVYDTDSTKVYLSDNLRTTHHFSKEYFEEILSSHNGSYHILQVLKDGITGIKTELVSVLLQDGSEACFPIPVSHEQEVKIYLPIKLSPSFLAFPHHQEVLYQKLQVIPLQPRFLSLEICDLCLGFLGPVTAYLCVSDLHELEVDLTDKLEIGKSLVVTIQDPGFQPLPLRSKYFKYMKLQTACLLVTLVQMEEVGEYPELYVLRAFAVGQTTVATAWDKMGRRFTSASQKVEVFPPFKLIPKKVTLIPHSMMQVMSEEPQPQSVIQFSVTNCSIAEVNRLGQVMAGTVETAVIQGAIQVVSEDTGKVTVFSQEQVELELIQLKAVIIHVPATKLITATEMPVFVVGLNSMLTPFCFGNANPELMFQWSVSKGDVLDLLDSCAISLQVSVQLPSKNNVAVDLYRKAAGRSSVKVMVQCLNTSAGQSEGNTELLDEVQILVFDKLLLFSPVFSTEQILMSTNSQLTLYTNREGAASVSFQVLQCYLNYSVHEEHERGLLRAGAITGIEVLEVTSEVFRVGQTIVVEQSAERMLLI